MHVHVLVFVFLMLVLMSMFMSMFVSMSMSMSMFMLLIHVLMSMWRADGGVLTTQRSRAQSNPSSLAGNMAHARSIVSRADPSLVHHLCSNPRPRGCPDLAAAALSRMLSARLYVRALIWQRSSRSSLKRGLT